MVAVSAIAALMRGPMIGRTTRARVAGNASAAPSPAGASRPTVGLADPNEPGITAKQRANRRHYRKLVERRAVEVRRCPFCAWEDVQIDEVAPGRFAVTCPECECIGPVSEASTEGAIAAWNRAARGGGKR